MHCIRRSFRDIAIFYHFLECILPFRLQFGQCENVEVSADFRNSYSKSIKTKLIFQELGMECNFTDTLYISALPGKQEGWITP